MTELQLTNLDFDSFPAGGSRLRPSLDITATYHATDGSQPQDVHVGFDLAADGSLPAGVSLNDLATFTERVIAALTSVTRGRYLIRTAPEQAPR